MLSLLDASVGGRWAELTVFVFRAAATQIHSSLLSISVGAVIMPAAFHFALSYTDEDAVAAGTTLQKQKIDILQMSHGVSRLL